MFLEVHSLGNQLCSLVPIRQERKITKNITNFF